MKIKSTLTIVFILIICFIILISFYVYNITNKINQALNKNRLANSLVEEIFKMSILLSEYTVNHRERPKDQLQFVHDSIDELLSNALEKFNNPQEEKIINNIKIKNLKIDKTISRIYVNYEDIIHYNNLLEERLVSQVQGYSYNIFSEVFKLKGITASKVETAKTEVIILTVGIIVLFIILIFVTILFVNKNVLHPITKLFQGTKIIGQGNFDYRIENNIDNEIGILTKAFNDMTKKLQKTTVSNEKLKQEITKRKKEEKHIKYLSFHDEMTGLYNRRYFENEMLRLNKSRKLPISIIVTDIDGLKKINDNYGHKKGDEYIIMAAEILKKITRKEDIVSRIGGDEFAILLPYTDKKTVKNICKRIDIECNKLNKSKKIPISISGGSATNEEKSEELEDLFQRADALMYKNKNMLKNQK